MHYNKLSIVQFKQVKASNDNSSPSQLPSASPSTTIITKRRRGRPSKNDPKPTFPIGYLQMIASTQSLYHTDNIPIINTSPSFSYKITKDDNKKALLSLGSRKIGNNNQNVSSDINNATTDINSTNNLANDNPHVDDSSIGSPPPSSSCSSNQSSKKQRPCRTSISIKELLN